MRSLSWFVLIVALVGIGASTARAEDKAAARAAFRSATQHFNLGEYQDALADFKTAYRNFEDPSFLYNVAQCERLLGHKQEAIRAYRTYLANSPGAANASDVRAIIGKLEDEVRTDGQAAKVQTPAPAAPAPAPLPTTIDNPGASRPTLVAASTPPSDGNRPVYKRGWFWAAIVGGAAAVALGVGLGVGLTRSNSAPASATTTLGTIHPF